MTIFSRFPRRSIVGLAALAVGGLALATPSPAQAWWRGGVVFGFAPFPLVVAPPVYYAPPPVYYAPPPYYTPAPYAQAPGAPAYAQNAVPGQTCYAGPYVCPLDRSTPIGSNCSCPGNSGRVFGTVR